MHIVWCNIIKKQCNVPLCGLDNCTHPQQLWSHSLSKQILHPSEEEEEEEGWGAATVSERERKLSHAAYWKLY